MLNEGTDDKERNFMTLKLNTAVSGVWGTILNYVLMYSNVQMTRSGIS